jgi:hypothetical protein
VTGGTEGEVHPISWTIAEYAQGKLRTTKFNATACCKEVTVKINNAGFFNLFTLETRTDKCTNVFITK